MNRIDKTIVFHPLRSEQLEQILEIELGMVQQRVLEMAKGRFLFRVMPAARQFLLREGTDLKYGARHLKRAIERRLVYPIANLLSTEQVRLGDMISVDCSGTDSDLVFLKEAEGALIPLPAPQKTNEAAGLPIQEAGRYRSSQDWRPPNGCRSVRHAEEFADLMRLRPCRTILTVSDQSLEKQGGKSWIP